jgi:hypothetical protein
MASSSRLRWAFRRPARQVAWPGSKYAWIGSGGWDAIKPQGQPGLSGVTERALSYAITAQTVVSSLSKNVNVSQSFPGMR